MTKKVSTRIWRAAAAVLLAGPASAQAGTFTWNSTSGGAWDDTSPDGWNTSVANYPKTAGDVVNLTQDITGSTTINIPESIIDANAGRLVMTDTDTSTPADWSIAGTNALTINNIGAAGWISSLTGSNVISAPIVIGGTGASSNNGLNVTVTGAQLTLSGAISDGGTARILRLQPGSTGALILGGTNTYTGTTLVNPGTTLSLSSFTGSVASSTITMSAITSLGATLTIDSSSGAYASSVARAAGVTFATNGSLTVTGSSAGDTEDKLTADATGAVSLARGTATITINPNSTTVAKVTARVLTRTTGQGSGLVNGVNLGMDSTSTANVGRFILNTLPTLTGTTDGTSTGINAGSQNTKIVPFLVGEATIASGGTGTTTGTANTFVTYNATTGLRPLNPTDEFTANSFTAGNNTRITTATTYSPASNLSVNSLIIAGGDLTLASGKTLTDTSGALLFTSGNAITGSGTFTASEFVATVNSGMTASIGSKLSIGTRFAKFGTGTLVLNGGTANAPATSNTLNVDSGTVRFANNTVAPSTVVMSVLAGATLDYSGNTVGGSVGTQTVAGIGTAFSGTINLGSSSGAAQGNNFSIVSSAVASAETASGVITGDNAFILSLTNANLGSRTFTMSGTNTYTGPTIVNNGTLVINAASGNSIATSSQVTLADAANVVLSKPNDQSIQALDGGGTTGGIVQGAGMLTITGGTGQNFAGAIMNGGNAVSLTKSNGGLQILSGINTYTGATNITGGKLSIATTGSINGTSGITINGGELNYNSATALTKPITFIAGTLSGSGTLATPITITAGATLSPGNSPGILTVNNANETWAGGGVYNWQLLDSNLAAGTGWDSTSITGTGALVLTATSGDRFTLALQTLSAINPDTQGTSLNWDSAVAHQWLIASSANPIIGWDVADGAASGLFAVNTTNFEGATAGTFSVSKTGNDVFLTYSVPEPTMGVMAFVGSMLLLRARRQPA